MHAHFVRIPAGPGRKPASVSTRGLAREGAVIAFAMLVYFGVRNLTVGSAPTAFANAERLVDLEQRLSLDWEHALQAPGPRERRARHAGELGLHLGPLAGDPRGRDRPLRGRRERYYLLRNAMFVSGLIGFVFFALFPVAPPRMLDLGLVDTVTEQSSAYRTLQPPGLTNQFAAFPSLHAGWNLLVAIVLVLAFANGRGAVLAVALPSPWGSRWSSRRTTSWSTSPEGS